MGKFCLKDLERWTGDEACFVCGRWNRKSCPVWINHEAEFLRVIRESVGVVVVGS